MQLLLQGRRWENSPKVGISKQLGLLLVCLKVRRFAFGFSISTCKTQCTLVFPAYMCPWVWKRVLARGLAAALVKQPLRVRVVLGSWRLIPAPTPPPPPRLLGPWKTHRSHSEFARDPKGIQAFYSLRGSIPRPVH